MTQTASIQDEWQISTLKEVIDLIIDHRGKTPKKLGGDWSDSGYRAISAKSIKSGQLVNQDQMNILPESLYSKWMKDEVQYGDIFLTSEAPLGEHIIWKSDEKLVLSQRVYGIRTDQTKLDPFYFNYFIDSDFYQHELNSRKSGSTVSGIRQTELLKTKVILPSLPEQRAISSVLLAFDNKIELMRTHCRSLEDIAQALFKEWIGKYRIDDELPHNWRVGTVKEIVEIYDSQRIPLSSRERAKRQGEFPYYGATSVMDYVDDFLFDGIYLLLAEDGSVMDENGYPVLQYVWGQFWVNNHAHILQGKNGFTTEMLYLLFRNTKIAGIVNGAVQLKINQRNLLNLEVVLPDKKTLEDFAKIVEPIFEKIRISRDQIKTLSLIRDTLLPRLMRGEVRVNNFNN